ncbi:MAG: Hsp70 family protein [Oscillospiraceae bacterium]|nr:Hsp70 family protein [Oscillospiraceae bacterium]
MTLREWLDIRSDANDEVIDIFAQMCMAEGIIHPDDFSVTDGELVRNFRSDGYDEVYRPFDDDNAFVLGMMLFHKLTGDVPDIASAELLMLAAETDRDISLCECRSSLGDTVKGLTRIARDNRLTAEAALGMIADRYPSKAAVLYTDRNKTVMYRDEVPLTGAVTVYRTKVTGSLPRCAYPCTDEIRIPYRRKTAEVICPASSRRFEEPVSRPSANSGEVLGIYRGEEHFTAALYRDGVLSDAEYEGEKLIPNDKYENFIHCRASRISTVTDPARALAAYAFGEQDALSLYFGHKAHIFVRGEKQSSVTAPCGDAMTDLLYKDMLRQLKVMYHIDLSDAVLYSAKLDEVRNAAERIKCGLSYDDRVSVTVSLDIHEDVTLEYDRVTFENLVSDVLREIRSGINEALSGARMSRSDLRNICVSGDAMVMPCLETVTDMPNVKYYASYAEARGAALLVKDTSDDVGSDAIGYDIGTMSVSMGKMPVFEASALAGTPYSKVDIRISSEGLIHEDGMITLKLYSRDRGMEHVRSTFDPDGGAIHFLGRATAEYKENTRVIFRITADGDGIHVSGMRQKRKFSLFSKGEWTDEGEVRVELS